MILKVDAVPEIKSKDVTDDNSDNDNGEYCALFLLSFSMRTH